ncbi:OpgC domain-containing protein [Sphingomonas naphthae]|uniref:OpgC domain-containing protein n=1 Tax=Sphingomonas naphthae TaxID=1813468 RepID=A0ABY7TQR7_9SPHN|nr:OpgC domain-containing protein [Sphingomonas naphthae]WCT75285.1 OpgC domain-containing protein [Sphingomonas naphthae]
MVSETVTSPPAAVSAGPRASRDHAIDLLRGLALITITVNHLTGIVVRGGMKGMPFPTLSHYGFSSAAEIFFLLSGYLVGLVYLRHDRPTDLGRFGKAMLARAGKLYAYNLALFLLVLPLVWVSRKLAWITFYRYFLNGGMGSFGQFLIVYVQPFCLEILAAYMALMLLAPLFAWGLVRWPKTSLLVSIVVWAVSYHYSWLRLPGGTPAGDWLWNFSPGSWQLLFFCAMAAGRWRLLDTVRARVQANHWYFWGALAVLAVLTLMFLSEDWFRIHFYGQNKERLGALRVFHALVVCAVGLSAFWAWPRVQTMVPGRLISAIGSASLPCFVASVAISYAAGYLWLEYDPSHTAYLLLSGASIVALILFAQLRRVLLALRLRLPDLRAQPAI